MVGVLNLPSLPDPSTRTDHPTSPSMTTNNPISNFRSRFISAFSTEEEEGEEEGNRERGGREGEGRENEEGEEEGGGDGGNDGGEEDGGSETTTSSGGPNIWYKTTGILAEKISYHITLICIMFIVLSILSFIFEKNWTFGIAFIVSIIVFRNRISFALAKYLIKAHRDRLYARFGFGKSKQS